VPGRDHVEQETKQYPDGTVAVDGLHLNAPDGKLIRLVVARPGRTGPPKEKEKGHE
jgi:hypothetical protein